MFFPSKDVRTVYFGTLKFSVLCSLNSQVMSSMGEKSVDQHSRVMHILLLVLLCLVWGLAFVGIKIGLNYLSPVALTLLRFVIASVIFAFYFILRRATIPFTIVPWIIMLGLFGFTIYHLSLTLGEIETAAGTASLIVATTPIFIALLSRVILKERIGFLRAVGIVMAFLGLAIILKPNIEVSMNIYYVLAILPAPISNAIYTVFGKRQLTNFEPAILTGYAQLFALLTLAPFLSRSALMEIVALPLEGWIPVLLLGACSTVMGYTIWYKLLKVGEASIVGSNVYLISFVAILGSRIILNEYFTTHLILGGILVLIGIFLTKRK